MSSRKFYLTIVLAAFFLAILDVVLRISEKSPGLQMANYLVLGFFVGYTIFMYNIGNYSLKSPNPYFFSRIFIVSIFIKILLLSGLVFYLIKFMGIQPKALAVPLLLSYLIFTAIETWALMKMSKN